MRHIGFIPTRQLAVVLALVALLGSGCTSTNVHFQRVITIPPLPHIAPDDADDRFKLSYVVMNPRNQSYPPQTFEVKINTWFQTPYQSAPCHRVSYEPVTGVLVPETGKYVVTKYDFAQPLYLPGDPCTCRRNECDGGLTMTLRYKESGNQVPGEDTNLHITWDKSGDLTQMTITEQ